MSSSLRTPRLLLVPLDTRQLAARVLHDRFWLEISPLGPVHFGADHPGDLAGLYPLWLAATPHPGVVPGTWTMIHAAEAVAVGSVGIKGPVVDGGVEIGYGVVPSHRGQGLAGEALAAVCRGLFAEGQDGLAINHIEAETRTTNHASQSVLRGCGFVATGHRIDPSEGELVTWLLTAHDQRLDPQSDRDAGR